jgi:hypothetical protein
MQVEDLYARLTVLGVRDYVDKAEVIYVDIAGLPGYTALLLGCLYKIPLQTWVRLACRGLSLKSCICIAQRQEPSK